MTIWLDNEDLSDNTMQQSGLIQLVESRLSDTLSEPIRVSSAIAVDGGCINHSMKLETNLGPYFLKWNINGPKHLFVREAEGLEALRETNTNLCVPEVFVATEIQHHTPGLLVIEHLPLSESSKIQDEQLGQGLAKLHKVTNSRYGFTNDNYCGETLQNNTWNADWIAFFGQQRIWRLVKLIDKRRGIENREHKLYQKLVEKLPSLIPHQPLASLNHGDLWSGNYLYTQKGPALIDPACYYADREFDLALMDMFGGFSERVWTTYQESYPLPSGWKERRELYQLYHYLNHYYLFGGSYGSTALSIVKRYL